MGFMQNRIHRLLGRLSEQELEALWPLLEAFYYDSYMLQAAQRAQKTCKPGDVLTREEALRFLLLP